jgi:DNA polymerase-3 subunit gamma/tau
VDVLEIDGASNRGIDEIRQLRSNVNIRPSRARFKIYIIDEVHMLTREAFNALLKTLEEPPEHVKFIFCTTEANKIPITILSRCQRFDFAGIRAPSIVERLQQIVAAEGVTAEPAALDILARRANGSMRDSQSLLEQLLSFGGKEIKAADVHALLGTAAEARLTQLVDHLVARDAAGALADLDGAVTEGVDVGQLLEQLLGMFRDCMAAAVGCSAENLLYTPASDIDRLAETSRKLGLETILAIIQVLDQTLSRLRYSTQGRILAEMALVRICSLENLDELAGLVEALRDGTAPAPSSARAAAPAASQVSAPAAGVKKKSELEPPTAMNGVSASEPVAAAPAPAPLQNQLRLSPETVDAIWRQVRGSLTDLLGDNLALSCGVANSGPNRLAVSFPAKYTFQKDLCERPENLRKLEAVLAEITGNIVKVEFVLLAGEPAAAKPAPAAPKPGVNQRQLLAEKSEDPLIRRATELFGAQILRVEPVAESPKP